jgi:hypothetical protein
MLAMTFLTASRFSFFLRLFRAAFSSKISPFLAELKYLASDICTVADTVSNTRHAFQPTNKQPDRTAAMGDKKMAAANGVVKFLPTI